MNRILLGMFFLSAACSLAESSGTGEIEGAAPLEENQEATLSEADPASSPSSVDSTKDAPSSAEVPPPEAAPPAAEATPTPDLTPALFSAVAADDSGEVARLLDAGADANAPLPQPAPDEFLHRFRDTNLEFYVVKEHGLTPLMLASAMGYTDVVRLLIERGADRHAVTRPHKTFALWLAGRAGHTEIMQALLGIAPESEAARMVLRVNLTDQTAYLWKDGAIVRTMPISSGRAKYPTRKGRFVVTDKYKNWRSTLYPARMPYFLRLSCMDFGLHAGSLPGYPASHGCIRLPAEDAKALFAEVPVGTLVEIE